MAEVRLEGITKRHGTTIVIESLSLTVRDGEFFVLVGPSGCGKSTLLHLIAGIEAPTDGRIMIDGTDVTRRAPPERDVALVFQNYALYPHMTVGENLAFPLRVAGRRTRLDRRRIEDEVRRVAGMLGLESLLDRRPRELSGGQQQRVALGRGLIRRPRVFLLDEPLSNLDARLRADMRTELRRLHDDLGMTMIYVTHDQTEAITLADRIAVLHQGRLQQVGTPQNLYDEPANVFVAGFIGYPPMNLLDAGISGGKIMAGPFCLPLPPGEQSAKEGRRVTAGLRPEQMRIGPPSAPGPATVPGVVRLLEPTGTQIWVTVQVSADHGPSMLVGLADAGFKASPGDHATIAADSASVHLFDPDTGLRLGQMT